MYNVLPRGAAPVLPKKKVGFAKEPEKVQKVIIIIYLKLLLYFKYLVP